MTEGGMSEEARLQRFGEAVEFEKLPAAFQDRVNRYVDGLKKDPTFVDRGGDIVVTNSHTFPLGFGTTKQGDMHFEVTGTYGQTGRRGGRFKVSGDIRPDGSMTNDWAKPELPLESVPIELGL